jgi:hypothetical protein
MVKFLLTVRIEQIIYIAHTKIERSYEKDKK